MTFAFTQVENKTTQEPNMTISVRQGTIAFASRAALNARFVQVRVDAKNRAMAFLLTPHQGEGSFALSGDPNRANPIKIASCSALLKNHDWIAQGKYEARQDFRGYWIIKLPIDTNP